MRRTALVLLAAATLPASIDGIVVRQKQNDSVLLRVRTHEQPDQASHLAGNSACSLGLGFISVNVSSKCCFSAAIVSQRGLGKYGLARACPQHWDCEKDGQTPKPDFEGKALEEMCSEATCLPAVVGAMKDNWMAKRGAGSMASVCQNKLKAAPDRMDAVFYALRHGEEPKEGVQLVGNESGGNNSSAMPAFILDATGGAGCFPGHSMVTTEHGSLAAASLRAGDRVLVQRPAGELAFEPVLGFLHGVKGLNEFVVLRHSGGDFRATKNHVVFIENAAGQQSKLVADVQVGDKLIVASTERVAPSEVLSIHTEASSTGLYAPLTMSGTVVVDGVLASNYAVAAPGMDLPHEAIHAAFFPLRVYHRLGLDAFFAYLPKISAAAAVVSSWAFVQTA